MSTSPVFFPFKLREPLAVNRWITVDAGYEFNIHGTWTPQDGPNVDVVKDGYVWTAGNLLRSKEFCDRAVGEAVAELFETTREHTLKEVYANEHASALMKRLDISRGDRAYELEIQQVIHDALMEGDGTLSDDELVELCEDFPGVELIEQPEAEKAVAA